VMVDFFPQNMLLDLRLTPAVIDLTSARDLS